MAFLDGKWFYYFIFKVIKVIINQSEEFVHESKDGRKNLNEPENLSYKDYI